MTLSLALVLTGVLVLAVAVAAALRRENTTAVVLGIIGLLLLVFSGVHTRP